MTPRTSVRCVPHPKVKPWSWKTNATTVFRFLWLEPSPVEDTPLNIKATKCLAIIQKMSYTAVIGIISLSHMVQLTTRPIDLSLIHI